MPHIYHLYFVALTLCSASAGVRSVLFFFEDDGGFAIGAYGDKKIATPHLDALASRGTTFDNAYTSVSSCSPSRASLLSGVPTHQSGQFGLVNANFYSYSGIQSLPTILNNAGHGNTSLDIKTGIIGKYHVWSAGAQGNAYNFSWGNSPTGPGGCFSGASIACPGTDYNFVSRNITNMRNGADQFFEWAGDAGFFLYMGFGDSHRCGGAIGEFCEQYGIDQTTNKSTIPDWTPFVISPSQVQLPFWIQDTPIARTDYAHMYTAKNRMDQGIGLILTALESSGRANDTLIIYTADNGAPFAAGKTNFYNPGMGEPLIISKPGGAEGVRTSVLASELDLMPTILDWLGITAPVYNLNGIDVVLQGRSLISLLDQGSLANQGKDTPEVVHTQVMTAMEMEKRVSVLAALRPSTSAPLSLPASYTTVFGSFQWHEQQMYFPMRVVVASDDATGAPTFRYKLIYNIAHLLPYPLSSDLWGAPAFVDLEQRTKSGEETFWYRNFTIYLAPRAQWELFDLISDPQELSNIASDPAFSSILSSLSADIKAWQLATNDDWMIKYEHE